MQGTVIPTRCVDEHNPLVSEADTLVYGISDVITVRAVEWT